MARPSFFRSQKFRKLVHLLDIPRPHAVGHCEMLWHSAYESGDPFVGDAVDVELAAEWAGKEGAFVEAMVACGKSEGVGLLVPVEGGFEINDFIENAPGYVKERWRKRRERLGKSKTVRDTSGTRPGQSQNVCLSLPLPSLPSSYEDPKATETPRRTLDDRFSEIWAAYPKKVGKKDARKSWDAARKAKDYPGDEDLLTAIKVAARTWRLENREKKFIPNPSTWIRQGRWEDEEASVARPDWLPEGAEIVQ